MTTLFGQFPQNAALLGQFAIHATVGNVADTITLPTPPKNPGAGSQYYVRRDQITLKPQRQDDDLMAAFAVFMILQTNSTQ